MAQPVKIMPSVEAGANNSKIRDLNSRVASASTSEVVNELNAGTSPYFEKFSFSYENDNDTNPEEKRKYNSATLQHSGFFDTPSTVFLEIMKLGEIKTSFNELGQSSIPAYLGNIPKAVHSYESNSSFLLNYSGTLGQKINFYL